MGSRLGPSASIVCLHCQKHYSKMPLPLCPQTPQHHIMPYASFTSCVDALRFCCCVDVVFLLFDNDGGLPLVVLNLLCLDECNVRRVNETNHQH